MIKFIHHECQKSKDVNTMPSFLALPREIRDQIYSYLIKHEIKTPDFSSSHCASTFQLQFHPAIFQANRQIHSEASQTLYGLNCFALTIDPYSPCIPPKLETLARLSLCRWVKKFVVKVSFLDGLINTTHANGIGDGDGEATKKLLRPRELLQSMGLRLRFLVNVLLSIRNVRIEKLRVDWFLPKLKHLSLEYHLRLLGLFEPLSGRVAMAEVRAHASEADRKNGAVELEGFDEKLEAIGHAIQGGEGGRAAWGSGRLLEAAAGRT